MTMIDRKYEIEMKDLNCLIILLERRMQTFPASFNRNVSLVKKIK